MLLPMRGDFLATNEPTWGSWYWPSWFVGAIGLLFLVPECIALATNTANTLSWYVWRLTGEFVPGERGLWNWSALHVLIGGLLTVLFLWLIGHLVFGLWT